MDQEIITKGLIAGIIDHYLAEIAEDPTRSIRKLVDMAERTSDGPTQRICYQMMQQMAADESSPYFEMIRHLVTHTAPATVRTFGINLGHNAWTFGSGYIRQITDETAASISWIMLIDRQPCPDRIPFTEIADLVERGKKNKVFAWLLMASERLDEWDDYAELFRSHPDCVFGLCAVPKAIRPEILEEASEIPNLMILLNTDEPDWQPVLEQLSRRSFLYSVFRRISVAEQAEEVLSGSWLEEVSPHHPLMAFTLAGDDCPEETAREISSFMWDTRLAQVYPVLPVDLISDFLVINLQVTHREALYRVAPDGSVFAENSLRFTPTALTIRGLF